MLIEGNMLSEPSNLTTRGSRREARMLSIPYESEAFPVGGVANGTGDLSVTWDELLWAAVTVGRPNRHYVFRHGVSSMYEALFRWSLLRMALEQSGPGGTRLRATNSAKTLDPTEKGAVHYFLGMVFCKLFATKLLETPWLLHLDVFRPALDVVLRGRSRPDLVGRQRGTGDWHAFECKGRVTAPSSKVKDRAKLQAQRLVSVNGSPCALHVGAITFFRRHALQFYWRDPPTQKKRTIEVPPISDAWRHYYSPVVEAIQARDPKALRGDGHALVAIEGADVDVGVHPLIAKYLARGEWESAHQVAWVEDALLTNDGYQADGISIVAGHSWSRPFTEPGIGAE